MATKQFNLATIPMTAVLGLALLSGCHHDDQISSRGQDFTPPGAPTSVDRLNKIQAAKGAAADATLYVHSFDGTALNSLGKKKLDLILRGSPVDQPLTIYLDMSHDNAAARQPAVAQYLKEAGVQDSDVQIVLGPNLNSTTPTAYNLAEIYKSDGQTYNGEAADAATAAASGGAAAAPAAK